jgi:hypothetical protein
MPPDWEDKLRSWVKPPSDHEDTKRNKTEDEIKAALKASAVLRPLGWTTTLTSPSSVRAFSTMTTSTEPAQQSA